MRFGKRGKTLAAMGRKLFGDPAPSAEERMVAEERDAVLESQPEEQVMPAPSNEGSMPSMDPIQNLLTSLGRFLRQLNKAQGAQEGGAWVDSCMQELTSALEIALDRNLEIIRQPLIDMARVLASYESAGKPADCIPFLRVSYEILSLIAGDIIVGNEGGMVLQSWSKHYGAALETMEKDGVPLLEDEDDNRAGRREDVDDAAPDNVVPLPVSPPVQAAPPTIVKLTDPLEMAPPPNLRPSILSELREAIVTPADDTSPAGDDFERSLPLPEDNAMDHDFARDAETAAAAGVDMAALDAAYDAISDLTGETGCLPPSGADGDGALSEQAWSEIIEEIREEPVSGTGETTLEFEEDNEEEIESPEAPEEATDTDTQASADELAPDDSLTGGESPVETEQPENPPEPDDHSVEAINRIMQQAIMAGDVAQAKVLAIRLAAALARRQADTSQDNLDATERKLDHNAATIEEGMKRVADAEARVNHAETEIAAREEEFTDCRARVNALDEEILGRRGDLSDLDAEIQKLQEQRAAAAAVLHERELERDAGLAGESLIQTEIASLNEEEEAAREFLADARARLAHMREEREGIESEIDRIRGELAKRRRSIEEIERPLREDDATEFPKGGQDLLF